MTYNIMSHIIKLLTHDIDSYIMTHDIDSYIMTHDNDS